MPSTRPSGVLAGIGNTPLIDVSDLAPKGSARVLLKLEWANPTGSMKDRMALAAIEGAEAKGLLRPGGTVVEYTAGTTGISLAFICAAKGYKIEIVYSDAFSLEKRQMMEAFGATVTEVKSIDRAINAELVKEMIEVAGRISARPDHWWCDQLNNHDAISGYVPLGQEIWQQSQGSVTAFVHAVSTAHSIHGVTQGLWQHDPAIRIYAVEPAESSVLSGLPAGSHQIEGIGIGFIPPLWHPDQVHGIERVSTSEAKAMARRLARDCGIFAGTSTGANLVAALRLAERLGPTETIATLACDSGTRYLSTGLFA
jgi:cysteine synthase A